FFWTWDGFQRTAIMVEEVKEPRRTIPFAIVGGISLAAMVYLIVATTTLGVLGPEAMGKSDTPVIQAATRVMSSWGGWVILASACITTMSEMMGDLMSTSRVALVMGEEKELPRWLGSIQSRFKSPDHALLVISLIAIALCISFNLRPLMGFTSACTLVWYGATHWSAIKIKTEHRLIAPWVSWAGLAGCVGLAVWLPVWDLCAAAGFLIVCYVFRAVILRHNG